MRRGLLTHPSLSLESIQFQDGSFFKELTLVLAQLRKVPKEKLEGHELFVVLSDLIRRTTGLHISAQLHEQGPAIVPPPLSRNHPLVDHLRRHYTGSFDGLRLIQETQGSPHGTVNLRTGRASGFFAELTSTLLLPQWFLHHKNLTAEELAAAVLHEIGHVFTYFEYLSRTVTTNQVLAGIAKALDGSDDLQTREIVLVNAKQALKLKELDTQELAKSRNTKVVQTVVVTSVVRETCAELGANVYDGFSWEYLSDQYAARHGAGRHLVTALDKLGRETGHISYRSLPLFLFLEALKLVLLVAPIFAGSMVWIRLLSSIAGAMIGADLRSDTYDAPEARARRMRHQVVERLKDKRLKPEMVKALTEDLAAIDEVLEHTTDRRQLLAVIGDAVLPGMRRQYNQLKLQQDLEALAANDLFVKAQELKHLA